MPLEDAIYCGRYRTQVLDDAESVINRSPVQDDEESRMLRAGARHALIIVMKHIASGVLNNAQRALVQALRTSGGLGLRSYVAGQWLSVKRNGTWQDVEVIGVEGLYTCAKHTLRLEGGLEASLELHPWNHSLRELPSTDFEALRNWWAEDLRRQHTQIADALTGRALDALQQCVGIDIATGLSDTSSSSNRLPVNISDVHGLIRWMHVLYAARQDGEATRTPSGVLLAAGPAAGKTTMISQSVMLLLASRREDAIVPVVVKVQSLQSRLLSQPEAFQLAWNWIDA